MINRYVIANWKMNMTLKDIKEWLKQWNKFNTTDLNVIILIAPSSIHLYQTKQYINELNIKSLYLCSQNVSSFEIGAHTGEISAIQISDLCKYSIVGHSETKPTQTETLNKAKQCLNKDITPILCFQDSNKCNDYYIKNSMLAWEDPNNISKDGVYYPKDPETIKSEITKIKANLSNDATLLYGGSVNENNVVQLSSIASLDGVLVGNASLKAGTFYEICKHL